MVGQARAARLVLVHDHLHRQLAHISGVERIDRAHKAHAWHVVVDLHVPQGHATLVGHAIGQGHGLALRGACGRGRAREVDLRVCRKRAHPHAARHGLAVKIRVADLDLQVRSHGLQAHVQRVGPHKGAAARVHALHGGDQLVFVSEFQVLDRLSGRAVAHGDVDLQHDVAVLVFRRLKLRGKIRGVLLRGDDEAVVRGQGYALPLPDPVLPD